MGADDARLPGEEVPNLDEDEQAQGTAEPVLSARRDRGQQKTLAGKIDHLFRTVHPRGRGEYSSEEAAEEIRRREGPTISATYIWQLRKGLRDNPTKRHLEALADFFGVSPLYFFDDEAADRVDQELDLLVMLRDAPVRHIATRSVGLSPQSLEAIAGMIEHTRRLEGLPNDPPDAGTGRRESHPGPKRNRAAPSAPAQSLHGDEHPRGAHVEPEPEK